MNPQRIKSSLRELYKSFRKILEDDARDVIEEAIAGIETSRQQYDDRKRWFHDPHLVPMPWGYQIHPDRPLRFKTSNAIRGVKPRVDVYSTVLWINESEPPVNQNTHLRIWSTSNYAFRETLDADELLEKLTDPSRPFDGRVMWRCHFDLAETGQSGPKYHVQFGGNAREYELCWIPEIIDIPRLACPPMDLILVCQLVAANFFWNEYCEFRDSPEWMMALRHSQEHLLKNYYKGCLEAVDNNRSLLDHLWNV